MPIYNYTQQVTSLHFKMSFIFQYSKRSSKYSGILGDTNRQNKSERMYAMQEDTARVIAT